MSGSRALVVGTVVLLGLAIGCARTARLDGPPSSGAGLAFPLDGWRLVETSLGGGDVVVRARLAGAPAEEEDGAALGRVGLTAGLRDVYFDFDRAEIVPEEARILDIHAEWLKERPAYRIVVEGHADARGTDAYNLALGDRRARAAVAYLVSRGVAANRLGVISYGEERPACTEPDEGCWARNRRARFALDAP